MDDGSLSATCFGSVLLQSGGTLPWKRVPGVRVLFLLSFQDSTDSTVAKGSMHNASVQGAEATRAVCLSTLLLQWHDGTSYVYSKRAPHSSLVRTLAHPPWPEGCALILEDQQNEELYLSMA
jgi:hypothetical protein